MELKGIAELYICDNCGAHIVFSEDNGLVKYGNDLKKGPVDLCGKVTLDQGGDDFYRYGMKPVSYTSESVSHYPDNVAYYALYKLADKNGYGKKFNEFYSKLAKGEKFSESLCTGYSSVWTGNSSDGYKCKMPLSKPMKVMIGQKFDVSFHAVSIAPRYESAYFFQKTRSMKCPICGSKSVNPVDFTLKNEQAKDLENCSKERTEKILNSIDKKIGKKASLTVKTKGIKLVEYYLHLVNIESNILYFEELLESVICTKLPYERKVVFAGCTEQDNMKNELTKRRNELIAEKSSLEDNYKINEDEYDVGRVLNEKGMVKPLKPIKPEEPHIIKPMEPVLAKPGLFNRKKVEQANAMLMQAYNSKIDIYNKTWEDFRKKLDDYNAEIATYEERRLHFDEQSKSIEQELNSKKEIDAKALAERKEREQLRINKAISDIDEKESNISETVDKYIKSNDYYVIDLLYTQEVNEIEEILTKLIECREKLYSLDIIYPKYRNLIALTTIYEYLKSGRCNELEGQAGAYNLFESETRANIIIAKLEDISESLEQIQANQYLLYNELKAINSSINDLKGSLNDGIGAVQKEIASTNRLLEDQTEALDSIRQNTKMTAYYAEKTAEYAKRNIKYTEALTFISLLK